jgi:hypothetical protein
MNQIINHFKLKPVFALLLCFGVLAVLPGGPVEARKPVLVLPFKVTPTQEKARIDNKEKNSDILNFELVKLYFKIIYPGVVKWPEA